EAVWLVSLPADAAPEAAALVAASRGRFAALLLERDEASLTVADSVWARSPLRPRARAEAGPWRVLTFDLDLDLDVVGYLAPAAARLAEAGVSIVPHCGFLKDHLLVREADLERARAALEGWIAACGSGS
ncbi:MAG TPA: ACT domain-containing protein, partial [Vicinamibacteria bacterium]|nr:ACT domain-containing protein [Vicinamibacteria bacterium]